MPLNHVPTTREVAMESVILLDDSGRAVGAADKATVHHRDTPLHLAFSCYLVDSRGRLLLTRRALSKKTWPGVWTNSCCGHPGPDEPMAEAVLRRLRQELGLDVPAVDLVLPRFRYRAVMDDGVVENEWCPVYRAVVDDDPRPDPSEVEEWTWVDWAPFAAGVRGGTRDVSPWCRRQVEQLDALGRWPAGWPIADSAELPPAARPASATVRSTS
ncbi:isopentenyl-diphosphate Delta-isomerase [Micromonospora sp. WMMD1082]|uniref:isopentenyl-diphosphate Delta-isomerase n=1 Tax=Micromonospora sp. WMMD1082 TaxID=3016104 RepID=UPI002416A56D|nr:isopentenyl-diphosphate Delta-isomerase [Micromonospora sp. WMMD1082]MDG4794570.1 isopentenyl-diphosphate Delta-isomerase [Micromonospora sp. WMMD1082]